MGRERVLAMDLLRGLAVAAMIGVHTVNALLDPALRQGALSAVVHFASGLVAPAFPGRRLHPAGQRPGGHGPTSLPVAAAPGARPHRPDLAGRLPPPARLYAGRLAGAGRASGWQEFLGVDVLHRIGASLLMLLVLRLVVPGGPRPARGGGARRQPGGAPGRAGVAGRIATRLPLWLSGYLAPFGTTLFPLLPCLAFARRRRGPLPALDPDPGRRGGGAVPADPPTPARRSALPGLAACWCGDHLHLLVDERPRRFFLCRLGFVLLFVAAGLRACRGRAALAPLIAWPARESLLFYVLHLKLLYHPLPGGQSLVELLGPHLGYPGCVAVAGALFLVTLVPAVLWHRLKSLHPQAGPRLVQAFLGLGLVVFLCA